MRAMTFGVICLLASLAHGADLPPAPAGVVVDDANLFSTDERATLEAFGSAVLKEQGVALRVLTIADARDEEPRLLAIRALNAWHVGPKSVLLLLVLRPRALYLQPGTALARTFDSTASASICSSIVAPQMRLKAYGSAALAGLTAIRRRLVTPQPVRPVSAPPPPVMPQPTPIPEESSSTLKALFGAVVLAFPAYLVLAKLFAKKCPNCRTRMSRTTEVIRQPDGDSEGARQILYLCDGCNHSETVIRTIAATGQTGQRSDDYGSSSSSSSSSNDSSSSSSDGSGGGGSSW